MRYTDFNLYESIRLKSNNKIPKMKISLMLFLVCLLNGVYSDTMETLKPGKAVTEQDPKPVTLSNRFLGGIFDFMNVFKNKDADKSSTTEPIVVKPNVDSSHGPKSDNQGPYTPNPVNEVPYSPTPKDKTETPSPPKSDKKKNIFMSFLSKIF